MPLTHLCGTRSCVDGLCKLDIYVQSRSDRRGNCRVDMCDSAGYAVARPDLDDFYDDGNPCTRDFCDQTENDVMRRNAPLEAGPAPNGSGFCNGIGDSVDCLRAEDCGDPSLTCSENGACVPLECANRVRDEAIGESTIDCGGRCEGCRKGAHCNTGTDCLTGVCGEDKLCGEASCRDGIRSYTEADVDCGGTFCEPCADGQGCKGGSDCVSNVCFAGKCQPRTCDDGLRNGDEEDVDCGADCPPCQF
ncbi:hypothetical protein WMF38_46090 [Sorangium sp. So ce118]